MIHIAYIIYSMSNSGGMERGLTTRANMLCDEFDITIITEHQNGKPYYFSLDKRIKTIDLDIKTKGSRKDIKIDCKQKLETLLKEKQYNIVVTLGGMEMFFLHNIQDGSKKVLDSRFSYDVLKLFMKKAMPGFKGKIYGHLYTLWRNYHARKYDHIVVQCEEDCHRWKKFTHKVSYIHNSLTLKSTVQSTCENHKAIAIGRLEYQKGFDYLIDTWKIIHEKHPDWTLDIFGEGILRKKLQSQIDAQGLSEVISMPGKTDNVAEKLTNASIFVLSSREEGFPNVVIEAEQCGLPIVSFACPYAPAVFEGRNGFVVKPIGNIRMLEKRICQLIENENLRKSMGRESKIISEQYQPENIKPHWVSLFNSLYSGKI